VASHLVGEEVNQVMESMKSICEKREDLPSRLSIGDNDLNHSFEMNFKEENIPIVQEMQSFGSPKVDNNDVKSEIVQVVKKECDDESKPVKKRGIKKGSSITGCVDKKKYKKRRHYQTWPKTPLHGPCKCPLCKKLFNISDLESEKLYQKHLYVHRVRKFDCQCDKAWDTDKDLNLHIYNCHRGNFHCEDTSCRQTFQTEDKYEEHVAADPHKEEASVCDDCGFTSSNKPTFFCHMKYHHDKTIKICELCSKEFEGDYRLKLHVRTFHAENKPCPLCGEMSKNIARHMRTKHTKDSDKKYQCDQCVKGFLELAKLEGHKLSVHIKARPYVCRFGCGAATSDKGNRKKHEVSKHGKSFEETEAGSLDSDWVQNSHMEYGQ